MVLIGCLPVQTGPITSLRFATRTEIKSAHARAGGQTDRIETRRPLISTLRRRGGSFPSVARSVALLAASSFEWTATHEQEFLGVPASGRRVRVWGVVIDRPEDGRIKDTRTIMDTLGLMMQLGVFPPPAT